MLYYFHSLCRHIMLTPEFLMNVATFVKTADLVTFTEEVLNGKLHFLCSALDILVSNVIFQFSPICSVH